MPPKVRFGTFHSLATTNPPADTRLPYARSMGVHGCTCDPRSIGPDRRVDTRMVACREAAA